jgi:acyl carrier protein
VAQAIRDFITSNFLYEQKRTVANNDSFMEEGILDSTGVVQLVAFLEETYGITISDEELIPDNLDSISKVTSFVAHKNGELTNVSIPLA